jgi:hypothetical protein
MTTLVKLQILTLISLTWILRNPMRMLAMGVVGVYLLNQVPLGSQESSCKFESWSYKKSGLRKGPYGVCWKEELGSVSGPLRLGVNSTVPNYETEVRLIIVNFIVSTRYIIVIDNY